MRVEVHSAYVAGKWCADLMIPNRQEPVHLERSSRPALERAVIRTVRAAVFPPGNTVTVQWHVMRPVL